MEHPAISTIEVNDHEKKIYMAGDDHPDNIGQYLELIVLIISDERVLYYTLWAKATLDIVNYMEISVCQSRITSSLRRQKNNTCKPCINFGDV